MPSWYRLLVPVTLKQFLPPLLLRISAVQDLDPGAALALRDIRTELVLGYYSLQVHLADALKEGRKATAVF
jgi:hypothetical protein